MKNGANRRKSELAKVKLKNCKKVVDNLKSLW